MGAYKFAFTNNLVYKICDLHGIKYRKYWNEHTCLENAKTYESLKHWKQIKTSSYPYARTYGLIEKITALAGWESKTFDKASCLVAAKRFHTFTKWKAYGYTSYKYAKDNGYLQEIVDQANFGTQRIRPVKHIESKKEYPTLTAAAKDFGIKNLSTLFRAIKEQKPCNGHYFAYIQPTENTKESDLDT
jgi:hypothetical protein